MPPGSIESAAEQVGVAIDRTLLQKMEEELRKQNKVSEQEMKKAELIKTKSKFMNVQSEVQNRHNGDQSNQVPV